MRHTSPDTEPDGLSFMWGLLARCSYFCSWTHRTSAKRHILPRDAFRQGMTTVHCSHIPLSLPRFLYFPLALSLCVLGGWRWRMCADGKQLCSHNLDNVSDTNLHMSYRAPYFSRPSLGGLAIRYVARYGVAFLQIKLRSLRMPVLMP